MTPDDDSAREGAVHALESEEEDEDVEDQAAAAPAVATPPRYHPGDIIHRDVGDKRVLAEDAQQIFQLSLSIARTRMELADLRQVATKHII